MKMKSLDDLLIHELRDLLSAEKQLVKALPKMAKAATSDALREAFESHLEETKGQVERLEKVFELLGKAARAEHCNAMEGLIEEGSKVIEEEMEGHVKDAALIGAAQRVEHYEIAGYGTARTFAEMCGHNEAADLLQQTLDEEKGADEMLNDLAMSEINLEAAHAGDE